MFGQDKSTVLKRLRDLESGDRLLVLEFTSTSLKSLTSMKAVPSVNDIEESIKKKAKSSMYITIKTPVMHAQLRLSRAPFYYKEIELARLDIMSIATNPLFQNHGIFTQFLRALTAVANKLGRIVLIESVSGPKLMDYINKRKNDFYNVPLSNNFIYVPSIQNISTPTYDSIMLQKAKQKRQSQISHIYENSMSQSPNNA